MIYAYDRSIPMPVKDLYDTLIMGMALNAAKDMYDRGLKQIEDFYKLYGDFTTPIEKDMLWYNDNVVGRMLREINNLYEAGIDPLRSAEGRAAISRLANSMPIGTIGAMRENAELYKHRLNNVAKLGDKYNLSMDLLLNGDPSLFSTIDDAGKIHSFNYGQPSAYQTIDELFEPIIQHVKPIYDENYTKLKNDGNDWYSITTDRMMQAVDDNIADVLSTPSGKFHYFQSKLEADRLGKPELAMALFKNKIANRLKDHEYLEPKVNQYKLADYKHRQATQLAAMNHANALARQRERLAYLQTRGSRTGTESKEKEQYTDSEWQFKRLTTGILRQTDVGKSLNIGNATQFDYDLMSGNTLRRAQLELIGKYYANDTSKSGGLVRKAGSKGISFNNYVPSKVNLDEVIGTGKMSWDEVKAANRKYIDAVSSDLSSKKFIRGIGREIVNAPGMKQYVYLPTEDIDRIYTGDYIALSSSGMNRPADLSKAREKNQAIRSALQLLLNLKDTFAAMRGAGKIVGLVSSADGLWHTFAKIDLSTISSDGKLYNDNNTKKILKNLKDNTIYIDLGIDSYKNPNYGKNGDYNTNLTIDPNGVHEDLRNVWDANVNKELRVGAPNVGSTIAIPEMYDPDEFDWDDYDEYYN